MLGEPGNLSHPRPLVQENMPKNIEIKAHAHDPVRQEALAAQLATEPPRVLCQTDTFFPCLRGRLKLRELASDHGELIYYNRPDQAGPKQSEYSIFTTNNPASLRDTLAAALGIRGTVRKRRTLYLTGQTRIHVDEVEGLGHFLELEVVLNMEQSSKEGQKITEDLMHRLDIRSEDLVDTAYIDLLEK